MEELGTKLIAAGGAYDLDGHVKMHCTLRGCLYLSRASFSALLSVSAFFLILSVVSFHLRCSSLSPSLIPTLPHPSLFSASFSTCNALFSWSITTECILSVHTHTRTYTRACTHPCAHTRLSIEIEIMKIMIMCPSVCIKVLPIQKKKTHKRPPGVITGSRMDRGKGGKTPSVFVCVAGGTREWGPVVT